MELYTTDLLGLTLQEGRLQSNFQFIANALKDLQEQTGAITRQHDQLLHSLLQNRHQIEAVGSRTQKHHSLLLEHSNWIQQLNAQFSPVQDLFRNNNEEVVEQEGSLSAPKSMGEEGSVRVSEQRPGEGPGGERRSEKGGFQEMIASLRERLKALERENEAREAEMEEMRRFLSSRRTRDSEQRRGSVLREYCCKSSGSKKEERPSALVIELRDNQQQTTQGGAVNRRTPSLSSQEELFLADAGSAVEERLASLGKELQRMKEAFTEKNRILDAQLRQSHQKVQGLQKSVDILERSHDMLKYDFERTSSSSMGRGRGEGEAKARREERLNDTRVTNKEYYQEKLVQLFNEMDQLRGEYFQLQSKLEREGEGEGDCDQSRGEGRVRVAQKLAGSQREGDEARRELLVLRAQLRKLRAQFNELALGVNSGGGEVRTVVIKPNENKEDWKSLSTKMQRLRAQMQAGLREVEGKVSASNEVASQLGQLQAALEQVKVLLRRKVESSEFDKTAKRIESRLNNFILQVFEKQGQQAEFDAALAKQPWFCLSCDSELKGYAGRGRPGQAEKLLGRKVNPQSHMVRRNDNGRLPSVIK